MNRFLARSNFVRVSKFPRNISIKLFIIDLRLEIIRICQYRSLNKVVKVRW